MPRMTGKVALITGAGSGMGRTHAIRLAQEGADIIALDLNEDALAETATQVADQGSRIHTAVADVRDLAAVNAAVVAGVAELGRLDTIVANAGITENIGPSWTIGEVAWDRCVGVNLTGVWNTVRAGASALDDSGGSIIIISSTAGLSPAPGASHYGAAKHAVVGLAKTLATELGPRMIRVNTVHPGAVGTAMTLNAATFARLRPDLAEPQAEDAAEVLSARHLLPVPWVDPEDVSNAVLFLASDEARYITGTALIVDAGLTGRLAS